MVYLVSALVSGANVKTWDANTDLDLVDSKTYLIDVKGITINSLGCCGSGISLCSGFYTSQFAITNWGLIYRYCETNNKNWTNWRFI